MLWLCTGISNHLYWVFMFNVWINVSITKLLYHATYCSAQKRKYLLGAVWKTLNSFNKVNFYFTNKDLCRIPGHATQVKAGLSGTWAEADRSSAQVLIWFITYIFQCRCGLGRKSCVSACADSVLCPLWIEWGSHQSNLPASFPWTDEVLQD